jgi:hypothetical protein
MLLAASGAFAQQGPFTWWGELGYDFLSNQFESANDRIDHTGLLQLNTAGFIHKPWLATLDAGVGMYLRRSDTEGNDSTNESILGRGILRMFPQSPFPTELFASKSDSRTDTDLSTLVLDQTRYGINQSFSTETGMSMQVGYEHSDTTNASTDTAGGEDFREDVSDLVKARLNYAFDAHSIGFNARAIRTDIVNSIDFTESVFSTLRHAYSPSSIFSSEDMLTYNSNDIQSEVGQSEFETLQFNSFGFWRPHTKRPLRINGTVRAVSRESESSTNITEAQTVTATMGATFEWPPRWVFNANAGITEGETDDADSSSNFQSLRGSYSSRAYKLFDMDAAWFTNMDLRNTVQDDESLQEAGGGVGYSLNKSIATENRHTYSFGASQNINATVDSDDLTIARLLTTLNATWSRRGVRSNGMARFSLSDNRVEASGVDADTLEGEFQLINLQASVDNKLSSTSSFRANATLQISRTYKPAIEGVIDASNGDWRPTSTIDLTYYKLGLFNVPRLSFYSTFRHLSNTYIPLVNNPDDEQSERNDNIWENRLEYSVGLLRLRAVSRLQEVRGEKQNYFLFQIKRFFGDI